MREVSAPLPIAVIAWLLGRARVRLEPALRLDQPHHRRRRPGVPGGGQDAAGNRARPRCASSSSTSRSWSRRSARTRPTIWSRSSRNLEVDGEPHPADRRPHLLPDHRDRRQRDDAQRDDGRHARLHRAPGPAAQAAGATRRCSSPRSRRSCAGRARSSTSRRTATRDVELRGKMIKAGEALALFYPSANRDEEVFDDADAFRVDRNPNPHLASASASTSAWARTWRASSWRWRTSTCCRASRRSSWRARSTGCTRRSSAASSSCRSATSCARLSGRAPRASSSIRTPRWERPAAIRRTASRSCWPCTRPSSSWRASPWCRATCRWTTATPTPCTCSSCSAAATCPCARARRIRWIPTEARRSPGSNRAAGSSGSSRPSRRRRGIPTRSSSWCRASSSDPARSRS